MASDLPSPSLAAPSSLSSLSGSGSSTGAEPTPDWRLDGPPLRARSGSFFRRVFLWILGMSLLMSVGSSTLFYMRQKQYLEADLKLRAATLLDNLAGQVATALYAQDRALLSVAVQRLAAESDVSYVALHDAQGKELVHVGDGPAARPDLLAATMNQARPKRISPMDDGGVEHLAAIYLSSRDPLDAAYARFTDEGPQTMPIGVARIRFNLEDQSLRLQETLRWGALLGLSLLLLGAAAAYFIAGKLSVPILALARGADEIRAGNLHPRIDVKGQDEVGILADSFLRMAGRLRQTMDALSTLNRNLEEEVQRRTRQLQSAYDFTSLLNAPIDRRGTDPGRLDAADTKAMLERALQVLCEATAFRGGGIFLPDDEDSDFPLALRVCYGVAAPALQPPPTREQLAPQLDAGPITVRERLTLGDAERDRATAPAMVVLAGGRLALPLSFRDQILGALVLLLTPNGESSPEPDPNIVAFARQAAAQLAIAISNARVYARSTHLTYELTERNLVLSTQRDQMRAQRDQLELQRNQLELQSRQLREQRNQLQEVNRLKSEFLASVSHELRTPLNAIMGYAELVSEGVYGPVSAEAREALGGVLESSTNLLNLINQILDLARVEAGKMETHLERVDVLEVAGAVIKVADTLCRDRPYRVGLRCEGRPQVETDRAKLRQILTNLVANAVKFTPAGSVDLRISVADGALRCDVVDTGIGIRREHQAIIFEEFRQVDGSSTRRFGGTGLGLAIARRMSELLGGTLTVVSEYGAGSTFTLRLPQRPAGGVPSRPPQGGTAQKEVLS